ncbi:MAG: hypothetical protein U0166_16075 [Acidobacteriota bacterium]
MRATFAAAIVAAATIAFPVRADNVSSSVSLSAAPMAGDVQMQFVYYFATRTGGNAESRFEANCPLDERDNLMTRATWSMGTIAGALDLGFLTDQKQPGDVLQSLTYWVNGKRVLVSWDSGSIGSTAPDDIKLGTNAAQQVPVPVVVPVGTGYQVSWNGLTEPQVVSQGDLPDVPGALVAWNVYRNTTPTATGATFLASLPAAPGRFVRRRAGERPAVLLRHRPGVPITRAVRRAPGVRDRDPARRKRALTFNR